MPQQTINLPANTLVQVVISSESCNYLQKTVITWPNRSQSTFVTESPASPDSNDDSYDATNPTIVTYGMAAYEGPGGPASVDVSEKLPGAPKWNATAQTRVQLFNWGAMVESEGHNNPARYDWDDTVVAFSW